MRARRRSQGRTHAAQSPKPKAQTKTANGRPSGPRLSALGFGLWAVLLGLWALGFGLAVRASAQSPSPPTKSYLFFVASESSDQVALIRFGPRGAVVEHRTTFKLVPGDPVGQPDVFTAYDGKIHLLSSAHGLPDSELVSGPRSLTLGPDGRTYYVTTAHGFAGGELLQVRIAADSSRRESQPPDTVQGQEPLGAAPGAVAVTPDGSYAWVANSSASKTAETGWIAVIYLGSMVEVARIPTCAAPIGSRLTADGSKHYSVCTQDDALVEIDARAMKVARRLTLVAAGQRPCGPSAFALTADGSRIFVACQKSNQVLEVDAASWSVTRQIATGSGSGAIALTHDGRTLVVADRGSQSVSLVDVGSGTTRATIDTPVAAGLVAPLLTLGSESWPVIVALAGSPRSRVPMHVALSPDDRYAIVSISRLGVPVGAVQIIDLVTLKTVATVDVGPGAGGIVFWKEQ